jgi:hypothetical protein
MRKFLQSSFYHIFLYELSLMRLPLELAIKELAGEFYHHGEFTDKCTRWRLIYIHPFDALREEYGLPFVNHQPRRQFDIPRL